MRKQAWTIGGRYMLPDFKIKQKKQVVQMTEQEFVALLQQGGNVKLTSNIELTTPVQLRSSAVLDLNGHDIIMSSEGQDAIWVLTGGELTIKGKGNIVGTYYSLYAGGNAKVTINGGNFVGVAAAIYAQSTAVVEINAGKFEAYNEDPKYGPHDYTLNIKDNTNAKILVKGGKFVGFNPADNKAEGPGTNFVAEGYESVETESGIWEVQKIKSMIDSTKMYYGTIVSPKFKSFSELTEADVNVAIKAGTLKESSVKAMQTTVNIKNEGDAVVILIPSTKYKAYKDDGSGSNKIPFNEVNSGSNFHANGEVKLGKFSVFGEWYIVPGNLVIYVE